MRKNFPFIFAVVILPLWWIFFLVWQSPLVHLLAGTDSPAVDRALQYATRGTTQTEDIYFTHAEIAHLHDVASLYKPISFGLNFLSGFAWGVLLVAVYRKYDLRPALHTSARILLGLLVFGLVSLLFFPIFFEKFHELMFPQGNWMFPADSMLITIFPQVFWERILGSMCALLFGFVALFWLV